MPPRLTLNRGFRIIGHAIWSSPDNKTETVYYQSTNAKSQSVHSKNLIQFRDPHEPNPLARGKNNPINKLQYMPGLHAKVKSMLFTEVLAAKPTGGGRVYRYPEDLSQRHLRKYNFSNQISE